MATRIVCQFCHRAKSASPHEPLADDPVYPDIHYHFTCLNEKAGRDWQRRQRESDAKYQRYWSLMTEARDISCPACSHPQKISPKGVGHSCYVWELNCDSCWRITVNAPNAYENRGLHSELQNWRQLFLKADPGTDFNVEIAKIAQYESLIAFNEKCSCGGTFTVSSKPRCVNCSAIIEDSYFHYTYAISDSSRAAS